MSPDSIRQPVPIEFVGLARQLIRCCSSSWSKTEPSIERLVSPFRPWRNFTPMPRHSKLQALVRDWQKLPQIGRLASAGEFKNGALTIVEIRAVPAKITADDWEEPGLGLMVMSLEIAPPVFRENREMRVLFGLHAIARRYERGSPRDDVTILRDMMTVKDCRTTERGFVIPVEAGLWIGELDADDHSALIRTFVARE